jgi:hypothetical protein
LEYHKPTGSAKMNNSPLILGVFYLRSAGPASGGVRGVVGIEGGVVSGC